MKAVSPVRHPSRKALAAAAAAAGAANGCCCCGGGGGGGGRRGCLAAAAAAEPPGGCCFKGSPAALAREEDEAADLQAPSPLCLQCDMNDCYSRLRRLVPTIPPNKRVSKVEILQHVIDYILDLQIALDTHPALLRQTQAQQTPLPETPMAPSAALLLPPPRTPLSALNADPAGAVNKQGDSILCR